MVLVAVAVSSKIYVVMIKDFVIFCYVNKR